MPQGRLTQVLRQLEGHAPDPRLLVGPQTLDDAGVVLLGGAVSGAPDLALVQTVDFFPPVVDDPELYGAIAAANSLSDVYAMGGQPLSALCLASFPTELPDETIAAILKGGYDKVRESGAMVAGGHTVEGEIQFGFSVTGTIDAGRVAKNSAAAEGDQVYLTKSLGMGIMTTAAKFEKISFETLRPAALQMADLNNRAAEAMQAVAFHAATDVTGFGLAGHGRNLAAASGLCLRIDVRSLPIFPGAEELARQGVFSGGAKRGRAALADQVGWSDGLEDHLVSLCFDAETSGGLLIVVPPGETAALERELAQRNLPVQHVGEFAVRTGSKCVELLG